MALDLNINQIVKKSVEQVTKKDLAGVVQREVGYEVEKLVRRELRQNKAQYEKAMLTAIKAEIKRQTPEIAAHLVRNYF